MSAVPRLLEGLLVAPNLAIGQQTPQVASVLITACSIAKPTSGGDQGQPALHRGAVRGPDPGQPIRPLALVELVYR